MDTSNYPESSAYDERTKTSNSKNTFIIVLAIALAATWGYALIHGNSMKMTQNKNQTQIAQVTDDKASIQRSFDESLVRLDSMAGLNTTLKSKLTDEDNLIARQKAEIRHILNKKNASAAELAKARQMIADLNTQINSMEQQVADLTHTKEGLTADKVALTQQNQQLGDTLAATTAVKQDLEKKVDVASTLNASNIAITPIAVKGNGKEKVTTTAKHVNKLVVSFDVNNRIAQSGTTDIYVCITGPDGKSITEQAAGSNTFTTREEGDKSFTAKVPVSLDSAKMKNVEFTFTPSSGFQQGHYSIQIYQNGFMIGQGERDLKKGGLFS
jgi:hypothetical protein